MIQKQIVKMENVVVWEDIIIQIALINKIILIYKMVVGVLMEEEMKFAHLKVTYIYLKHQNPTKGHVTFSGFSGKFLLLTYGVVFKMP